MPYIDCRLVQTPTDATGHVLEKSASLVARSKCGPKEIYLKCKRYRQIYYLLLLISVYLENILNINSLIKPNSLWFALGAPD